MKTATVLRLGFRYSGPDMTGPEEYHWYDLENPKIRYDEFELEELYYSGTEIRVDGEEWRP